MKQPAPRPKRALPKQSLCDICKLAVTFLQQYVDSNATEVGYTCIDPFHVRHSIAVTVVMYISHDLRTVEVKQENLELDSNEMYRSQKNDLAAK